jgi:hypothetical protein
MGDDRMAINGRRVLRPRVAHREAPVSARTLRRHYALLSKVAAKVLALGYAVDAQAVRTSELQRSIAAGIATATQGIDQRIGHLLATALPAQAKQIESVGELVFALRGEVGERLAEFESHLRSIALAVNAPILPRWTKEQRAAFHAGEDAKTDAQIREGLRVSRYGERFQADGRPWNDAPGAVNITRLVSGG